VNPTAYGELCCNKLELFNLGVKKQQLFLGPTKIIGNDPTATLIETLLDAIVKQRPTTNRPEAQQSLQQQISPCSSRSATCSPWTSRVSLG
jgi:hypothetical protein